jgi:acyl-CoA thioesterase I
MSGDTTPVVSPPRSGGDIGDYSLRDFAMKLLVQQADLAEVERYRVANRELRQGGDGRDRIVLMGDSIIEFWNAAAALEGATWRAVNRGIAGQNSTQMLLRFEDDVVALAPRLLVLLCGTNDLRCYAGHPSTIAASALERITRNVTAMTDIAGARGIVAMIGTLPPVGVRRDVCRDPGAIRAVNQWLTEFATGRGLGVIDYHAALIDADGHLPPQFSEDGVHPNCEGYARMMTALRAALISQGYLAASVKSSRAVLSI